MINKKLHVLVTGASGFIGKYLVKLLSENDIIVTSLTQKDGDIRTLDLEIYGHQDQVIHLANRNFIPDSWANPGDFFSINVDGTRNVLEFCRTSKARCVYVSAYVYGQPKYLPIDEKHSLSGINPYMKSKIMAEDLVRFYAHIFEMPYVILRPFNIYGKGQNESFLIPTIIKQLKKGNTVHVQSVKPKRDFLHIDDFNRAVLKIIRNNLLKGIFNVGYGQSYSVEEIINQLSEIIGYSLSYKDDNIIRNNEVLEVVADISKIINNTNWSPSLTLKEGLSKMLASHGKC